VASESRRPEEFVRSATSPSFEQGFDDSLILSIYFKYLVLESTGMATYKDIQSEVRAASGFILKTCWIAHVLELLGIRPRLACNRIDPRVRKHPCPPTEMAAITAAIRKLETTRYCA
jgi:hypothetical protein